MKTLTCISNEFGNSGFVIALEPARLGNCLSSFANMFVFSIKTGIPIVYPFLDRYKDLFRNNIKNIYTTDLWNSIDINESLSLYNNVMIKISNDINQYDNKFEVVLLEHLKESKKIRNSIVFASAMGDHPTLIDFSKVEKHIKNFCERGNGLILPRAYWYQYMDMRILAPYGPLLKKHIGGLRDDACIERVKYMESRKNIISIAIHIRRTDYADWIGGSYFFEIDEYLGIMRNIHENYHDRPHFFVIFSDEPVDRSLFSEFDACYFEADFYDDFCAISNCSIVVGPPSTYSTWSCFFGNQKRIVLNREIVNNIKSIDITKNIVNIDYPTGAYLPGDITSSPL